MQQKFDWKRYVVVFFITAGLFLTAIYLSNYFGDRKINQLKTIQDKISLDLLSSDTQFNLLQEVSCKDISNSVLSSELNSLSEKISYTENSMGENNDTVISLKKYYSLLEIKDYLLMKKITDRCGQKSVFILYFYKSNDCEECTKQSYVLSSLRDKYPNFRMYSFDYNLDLSAVKAMISIYKVPNTVPVMVIDGKVYSGFKTVEDVEKIIPSMVRDRQNELKQKAILDAKNAKNNTKDKAVIKDENTTQ
ncbi:MAG: hypothetical protein WCI41_00810 [bacterium]